jgi:hypothetical protein
MEHGEEQCFLEEVEQRTKEPRAILVLSNRNNEFSRETVEQ